MTAQQHINKSDLQGMDLPSDGGRYKSHPLIVALQTLPTDVMPIDSIVRQFRRSTTDRSTGIISGLNNDKDFWRGKDPFVSVEHRWLRYRVIERCIFQEHATEDTPQKPLTVKKAETSVVFEIYLEGERQE